MRKLRRTSQRASGDIEPLWPKHTFPEGQPPIRKMSEVIMDFAEPALAGVDNDELFEEVLSFAAICWNLSFLPQKEQQVQLRAMVNRLGRSDPLSGLKIEDCARGLLERKRRFFAEDRRMIMDYKVVEEKGCQRLLVMSVLAKD